MQASWVPGNGWEGKQESDDGVEGRLAPSARRDGYVLQAVNDDGTHTKDQEREEVWQKSLLTAGSWQMKERRYRAVSGSSPPQGAISVHESRHGKSKKHLIKNEEAGTGCVCVSVCVWSWSGFNAWMCVQERGRERQAIQRDCTSWLADVKMGGSWIGQ